MGELSTLLNEMYYKYLAQMCSRPFYIPLRAAVKTKSKFLAIVLKVLSNSLWDIQFGITRQKYSLRRRGR